MPSKKELANTATLAQLQRTAMALRVSTPTTLDLREGWNVMHGAGRVYTLRHDYGWHIRTLRTREDDAQGFSHAGVARYVLIKEGLPV